MDINSRRVLAFLPRWVSAYAQSIAQLINVVLVAMGICNFFLFTFCFSATMLPNLGINALLISILLCTQNAITFAIFNVAHMPYYCNALTPSDFMVGMCLGTCIGGAILAFVISIFFGEMSKCVTIQMSTFSYACEHQGTMSGIWFWAGWIFWLNFAMAILIVLGRDELTYFAQSRYEDIGVDMEDFSVSYNVPTTTSKQHDAVGEAEFSTPSQEAASMPSGGYTDSFHAVASCERVPILTTM